MTKVNDDETLAEAQAIFGALNGEQKKTLLRAEIIRGDILARLHGRVKNPRTDAERDALRHLLYEQSSAILLCLIKLTRDEKWDPSDPYGTFCDERLQAPF
jgi:hypothetical protein